MKFFAQFIFVVLLCIAGGFALLGLMLRLHHPELPERYARTVPDAVLSWQVVLGADILDCPSLGPLSPGPAMVDAAVLKDLGLPDIYDERNGSPGLTSYYGLGLQLQLDFMARDYKTMSKFVSDGKRMIEPGFMPEGKLVIRRIILGNPNAASVDDPLVKACPFVFSNGLKLGDTRAQVRKNLGWFVDNAPTLRTWHVPALHNGLQLHFAGDYLVAVELVGCEPVPAEVRKQLEEQRAAQLSTSTQRRNKPPRATRALEERVLEQAQ